MFNIILLLFACNFVDGNVVHLAKRTIKVPALHAVPTPRNATTRAHPFRLSFRDIYHLLNEDDGRGEQVVVVYRETEFPSAAAFECGLLSLNARIAIVDEETKLDLSRSTRVAWIESLQPSDRLSPDWSLEYDTFHSEGGKVVAEVRRKNRKLLRLFY